jgi:hypothetical protein
MNTNELWQRAENTEEPGWAIAAALMSVALQLKYLGNGDAATPMGAIEAFGDHIGKKLDDLTNAISTFGDE